METMRREYRTRACSRSQSRTWHRITCTHTHPLFGPNIFPDEIHSSKDIESNPYGNMQNCWVENNLAEWNRHTHRKKTKERERKNINKNLLLLLVKSEFSWILTEFEFFFRWLRFGRCVNKWIHFQQHPYRRCRRRHSRWRYFDRTERLFRMYAYAVVKQKCGWEWANERRVQEGTSIIQSRKWNFEK